MSIEAQRRAVAKYNKAHYDRIEVKVPKGRKKDVEEFVNPPNQFRHKDASVNKLINTLLMRELGMSEEEWKRTKEE